MLPRDPFRIPGLGTADVDDAIAACDTQRSEMPDGFPDDASDPVSHDCVSDPAGHRDSEANVPGIISENKNVEKRV